MAGVGEGRVMTLMMRMTVVVKMKATLIATITMMMLMVMEVVEMAYGGKVIYWPREVHGKEAEGNIHDEGVEGDDDNDDGGQMVLFVILGDYSNDDGKYNDNHVDHDDHDGDDDDHGGDDSEDRSDGKWCNLRSGATTVSEAAQLQ